MNLEEYILSGILETYVAGELSPAEREEVEKNLLRYPALREELANIEAVHEQLLMRAGVQPKATVKAKLFQRIEAVSAEENVVPIRRSMSLWKLAAAASVSLALITSYLAIRYYSNWKDSEMQLASLIAQNQQMADNYNQVNQRLDAVENDVKIMAHPAFERVAMTGVKDASLLASVYWNKSTKEVYLKVQNMRELSRDQQYQLWAIVGGKPVDAGVFDGNMAGMLKMKEIGPGAVTFAVTIEPRGGKSSPTIETMQVAGNVVKS